MLKSFLKKIIVSVITLEARVVLWKYKPKIVAVTGSVGKTSTKDAIYSILKQSFYVRKSEKSFNSEVGVPLTILGCPNAWNSVSLWLKNILEGLELIFLGNKYPEWLVLEIGADHPGDIRSITKWIRPDIVAVTRIGSVPVHVEFFKSRDQLIREKRYLAEALKPHGVLILNADDPDVIAFKEKSKNVCITFGISNPADITASNEMMVYEEKEAVKKLKGVNFKLNFSGNSVPVTLHGVLGLQHLYPVLAAVAVASSQSINMVHITEALLEHVPPRGRMNVHEGIKDSTIIDDTYNSSPVALHEALDALGKVEVTGRKIAVLGDMLELGKYSVDEHKRAGQAVAGVADVLVVVGLRALYIKEGALMQKMSSKKIYVVEDSKTAAEQVKGMIKKGDLILVKGSQSMRMERIVAEIIAHPEKKSELLVRQEPEWLAR
jgi:UDP-N-acetylmuramyl pentapeptide synthase